MADHSNDSAKILDAELVQKTLENPDEYIHIIERYKAKLLRYIHRISGQSVEECEDILQEVFIKVYTNLRDFDANLKFSSWIYRITYNIVISDFRKRSSRGQQHYIQLDEVVINKLADNFDIQGDFDNAVLQEQMQKVFQLMKPVYRDVLVMQFLEGKSYQEISDIMKKPMGTIATLLNRAKKHFQKVAAKNNITF